MRIACFEVKPWEQAYLKKRLKGHTLVFSADTLTKQTARIAASCDAVSVFIYSSVTDAVLKQLPKVRLVTTRSTGFDHIDVAACKKRRITVSSVPSYGENTVAEHTFALILSLSRNIHKAYVQTLRHDYSIEGLKGFDLKGKTIGVVGIGHIGSHVIRIARGFDMRVLAYDTRQSKLMAEVLGFTYVPLEELLRQSDIITLHVPANEHTKHLINRASIKHIKKGALLINTARGSIIETEALIEALDKKILAGAGLDVLEGEELIKEEKQLLYEENNAAALSSLLKDHIVLSNENVVFTPHIAFYSQEALERILDTTVQNLTSFAAGTTINTVS